MSVKKNTTEYAPIVMGGSAILFEMSRFLFIKQYLIDIGLAGILPVLLSASFTTANLALYNHLYGIGKGVVHSGAKETGFLLGAFALANGLSLAFLYSHFLKEFEESADLSQITSSEGAMSVAIVMAIATALFALSSHHFGKKHKNNELKRIKRWGSLNRVKLKPPNDNLG
jgi:hypothetical protein